jgi:rhodanese-related sulfurtransferase
VLVLDERAPEVVHARRPVLEVDPGRQRDARSVEAERVDDADLADILAHKPGRALAGDVVTEIPHRAAPIQAAQDAQDAGLKTACHIEGGIDAWKKAGGALAR